MENRCKLLRDLSSAQFAAWELHLYLDTHECDKKALQMQRQYAEIAQRIKREYEELYGPLVTASGSGAAWLSDPWPWEGKECED